MKNFIFQNILFPCAFIFFIFGCNPNQSEKRDVQNRDSLSLKKLETLKPEREFDTLAFIYKVHNWPYEFGKYALASCDLLQDDDLKHIPPKELRIIRNEIFARYGYKFKDPGLQMYFGKQDWYRPLFDNVEEYLTPVEKENVKFIIEKEKTNSDVTAEEQFQLFLGSYLENTPRMLAYKYFKREYCMSGGVHFYFGQWPPTKNYVYLIHSVFGLCDLCSYELSIYQFNNNGELLQQFELGLSDNAPRVIEKSDNHYEVIFTYYSGPKWVVGEEPNEETQELALNTPADTIRFRFHYDVDGKIIFEKK
jgi:hypothetical protein